MMTLKKMIKNNNGAGLVSVIIVVAFVAILGSILMSATLTNYKMKQINLKTKDSFYSAEQALDEIRVGLQGLVSDAIGDAYIEVLENYAVYDLETKTDLMESKYFETIWNKLAEDPLTHTTYDKEVLKGYLVDAAWVGTDISNGYGTIISSDDNQMITYDKEGIVLKNIDIYYRDKKGFVSMIKTDIKLVLPNLQFASSTAIPDISTYTLIADTNLTSGTRNTNSITGNVYAGSVSANGVEGLGVSNRLRLNFSSANLFIVKKDLNIQNATLQTVSGNYIWANDIIAKSSNLNLGGTNNIADDLTITGTGTSVSINGAYNGYGNSLSDSNSSSAILVNGNDAELNLVNLDTLTLAGHAYIGTKKNNAGSTLPGATKGSGSNILTGESISVKSNQLMYLVPAECIGVSFTGTYPNIQYGKSRYARNPITASQYTEISNSSKYVEVANNVMATKVGNTLSRYVDDTGVKPTFEKVFIQTNGETLVYYYIVFQNENSANKYFNDYYANNKELINQYMDFYTNGITMKDPTNMIRLQLAGNALKYDGLSSTVQKNTVENASAKLSSSSLNYSNMFEGLCTRLVTNYGELSDLKETDLSKNIVFENIIDRTTMNNFLATHDAKCVGDPKVYTFMNGTSKAIITNNASSRPLDYLGDPTIHLIIATGDVNVIANFSGLIIADGTITLKDGVNIDANEEMVKEALRASAEEDGTVWNVIGFLWDGSEMLKQNSITTAGNQSVALSDLVIYENWTKK